MDNPVDQFIEIAPDCELEAAVVPRERNGKPSIATIEYELLACRPYHYTLEELKFATYLRRNEIPPAEAKARHRQLWEACFAKPYACMRASPLTKQYGFGAHYDARGRIALYPVESEAYRRFVADRSLKKYRAMRGKRA
jgi:hypothetical protein